MDKPSIIEIIGMRVELRRQGKELTGLCPFHEDKNPSFSVNEDKGLFHCFACGVSGDVIRFVELLEKCSFKEAVKRLQIDDDFRPRPQPYKIEAENITRWARNTSIKAREALRRLSDKIRVCALARKQQGIDTDLIITHEAAVMREWAILCDLDDDLNEPKAVLELYAQRKDIERIIDAAA